MFCRSLFVLLSIFLLTIVISVLGFNYSDYPFSIFKLFKNKIQSGTSLVTLSSCSVLVISWLLRLFVLDWRCLNRLAIFKLLKDFFYPLVDKSGIRICCVIVSAIHSITGFDPQSGQTKDYKICKFCFSAKHAPYFKEKEQRLVGSGSG